MQRLKLYIQIIKCAMHVIGKQENASIGPYMCNVNKIISKYTLQTKLTKAACIQMENTVINIIISQL